MKIDNSKMYDAIFDTAIRLANGMGSKDIELFWQHKLESLLFVVKNLSDTDLSDLFERDLLEFINDVLNGWRNTD